MQTNSPANIIGETKCVNAQDLSYDTIGALKAIKSDAVVKTYANTLYGTYPFYISGIPYMVSVAGTGVFLGDSASLKTLATKGKFSFLEYNGCVYCASAENTIFKVLYNYGIQNMGCPAPSQGCTITAAGSGDMNAQAGLAGYRVLQTYVSQHNSYDGGVYQTEGNPSSFNVNAASMQGASLAVTNLQVNADSNYNVVARRLYIQGGDEPKIANYFRALPRNGLSTWVREVSNNTATSCTIALTTERDGVDELTPLIQDNALPPRGAFILNNFDHFFISGNPTYKNRTYFAKVSSENFPSTNWIPDKEDIMGMVQWNNLVWTPTKSKLYCKTGASEDNFFNQDTQATDGCIAPYTLIGTPFGLVYMSYNGIVSTAGEQVTQILSKEIDNVFLSLPSAYYTNATAIYFDYEYWVSITESGYTQNNVTWVYNFRTNGWRKVAQGFDYFTKDEKAFKLYGARNNILYRINDGTTYRAWEFRTKDYDSSLIQYGIAGRKIYPKMFFADIDTKGQNVTLTPYYDDVAQNTITINKATRSKYETRLPETECYKIAVKLNQASSASQTILYSYDIEVET